MWLTIVLWSVGVLTLLFLLLPAWVAAYNWFRVPMAAGVVKLSNDSKLRLFLLVPIVVPIFVMYSVTTKFLRWLEK